MSLTSWFLVSSGGTRHRLPREMIFVGRDDCELMLQSRSVDKQHAVINYEPATDEHKVKDLGSLNGTFVNDVRIQEQMYFTLKIDDKLRFGYDTNLFTVVRGELHVPEEALKHEKFSSQLQLPKKPSEGETSKSSGPKTAAESSKAAEASAEGAAKPSEDKMAGDLAALHRGTPLYGQPSWWGDGDADDENSFKQEARTTGRKQESGTSDSRDPHKSKEGGSLCPAGQEPSYFEIPTKESLMAECSIHEVPTKDTESGVVAPATASASTEAASQGHASFTIEFDDASPGKVKIRDHVTKHTPDARAPEPRFRPRRSPQQGGGELSTLQAAMIAAESKVADWLAQNDPPLARMESTEEDSKSIKSDVPVHLHRLKGSKHSDGTQSDSENGAGHRFNTRRAALEQRLRAGQHGGSQGQAGSSRTTFTIEFYDEDNPRKQRSYSFSQAAGGVGGVAGGAAGGAAGEGSSRPKGSAPAGDHRGGVSPHGAGRLPLKQKSEEGSPAWSSASVGLQTSPGDDAPKPPRPGDRDPPEDDLSDKGTYTIELENQNPEEAEARRMIDKVFGVEEAQAPVRSGCQEHQQEGGKERPKAAKGELRKTYYIDSQTDDFIGVGSPRWVSQWASLAANHTRTDPEGSGGETPAFVHHEKAAELRETGVSVKAAPPVTSLSSHTERKRRTLPQPPAEEKPPGTQRGPPGPGPRSEIGEKQDTEPQEKESQSDPDPVGVAGRAEGAAAKDQKGVTQRGGAQRGMSSKPSSGRAAGGGGEKRVEDGRRRRSGERAGKGREDKQGKPLVRQGSFTIDRPSGNVPLELIPRIGQQGGAAGPRRGSSGSLDTSALLKDTQAVMAFLEAKLRDDPPAEGEVSPESDIDTASTVSQAAGEAERKATPKRRTLSSLHREKSSAGSAAKGGAAANANARERLERKAKLRPSESRAEPRRPAQPGHRGRQPSLDLTDDDITSSLPHSAFSDVLSSDQETGSAHGLARGPAQFASTDDLLHSKFESGKSGRSKAPQSPAPLPGKPATLPRPRPTRASLLRRARHGDASDTELADADRVSVASEVSTTSSTSRPPSGRKVPSRIDVLAQPRRTRLGSLSARSDSEATVARGSPAPARVSAETLLRLGLRAGPAATPRTRANSVSKLPDAKAKLTSPPVHGSPSESTQPVPESAPAVEEPLASNRWRRLPPEYASTSEDEFGSNRHPSKHARLRPGSAQRGVRLGGSAPSTPGPGTGMMKHRAREQEEYIRDWTAHSEEIARISQDLAKDLAMLAREIHDVAGEIDSVSSSGTAPSTTVSTAATTPGSALDTREELVDRVFDESLNFRKTAPTVQPKAPEINGRPVELRPRAPDGQDPQTAIRRRTWNRDEAVLDSLLLTSVSQLSAKIRQNVDKTAGKIRILFKDKDRNWEEIEGKLKAEGDVPLLKTSNKEIASILQELKRVEKQLQVINVMVDPDGTLDALVSLGLTSPTLPKPRTSPGAQGPLPGNGAARGPLISAPSEESERDFSLPLNRFTPSGEENSLTQE
ncbi:centrosomal protein of 170 kDa-like isoform X2 [Anguilla anguilla]|uniref:centrosomal protein of 170 kDa-like isoform X2 n=1 Tax=Anguilla anguilla TaxID=7936 RepID=UPI0015B0B523|nr:centrosomal protein of 170 kDa-like isoform X2 [Anguilla anguilla]